jgi:transcriptional regulator with XRE-family HTH domain
VPEDSEAVERPPDEDTTSKVKPTPLVPQELGARLRIVRKRRGIGVREIARRVSCSPSLISQIERGSSAPSASTLYALARELEVSVDSLFGNGDLDLLSRRDAGEDRDAEGTPRGLSTESGHSPLTTSNFWLTPPERQSIELATGVRWDRLTRDHDPHVDFLEVEYPPGSHSAEGGRSVRHEGREYGVVLSGNLHAKVGFEERLLTPGDSIFFEASIPHFYENRGEEVARVIWFIIRQDEKP